MGGIFINYRRDDSDAVADRLYDHLCKHFGHANLFRDKDTIPPGGKWPTFIQSNVESCDVLLAVIGRQWLTLTDPQGQRRLDDPKDLVCLEITTALERDISVIPVLVGGASLPRSSELPDSLRPLVDRQAFVVGEQYHFVPDVERLITELRKVCSAQPFPPWTFKAGVVLARVTLVLFLTWVLLNALAIHMPENTKYPIVSVLALGLAFAFAFIGGNASAKGQLPLSFLNQRPVQFSVAGGIAVFVIVFLLGIGAYPSTSKAQDKHFQELLAAVPPTQDSRNYKDLTGDWDMSDNEFKNKYDAKLEQTGNEVKGTYAQRDDTGTLSGVVRGNQLVLKWDQRAYNGKSGTAAMIISSNDKIEGEWFYTNRGKAVKGGTWSFKKKMK